MRRVHFTEEKIQAQRGEATCPSKSGFKSLESDTNIRASNRASKQLLWKKNCFYGRRHYLTVEGSIQPPCFPGGKTKVQGGKRLVQGHADRPSPEVRIRPERLAVQSLSSGQTHPPLLFGQPPPAESRRAAYRQPGLLLWARLLDTRHSSSTFPGSPIRT